jgi:hypothetical protein
MDHVLVEGRGKGTAARPFICRRSEDLCPYLPLSADKQGQAGIRFFQGETAFNIE